MEIGNGVESRLGLAFKVQCRRQASAYPRRKPLFNWQVFEVLDTGRATSGKGAEKASFSVRRYLTESNTIKPVIQMDSPVASISVDTACQKP